MKITDKDAFFSMLEKATCFQVDDNLCFGSIQWDNPDTGWTIEFTLDEQLLIVYEDELEDANIKGYSFDVEVDGVEYNITPFFSDNLIDIWDV